MALAAGVSCRPGILYLQSGCDRKEWGGFCVGGSAAALDAARAFRHAAEQGRLCCYYPPVAVGIQLVVALPSAVDAGDPGRKE
jgi:hypothetical protein